MRTRIRISVPRDQEVPDILFYRGKYYRVLDRDVMRAGIVFKEFEDKSDYANIESVNVYTLQVQEMKVEIV